MNDVKKSYWLNGQLKTETPYLNGKKQGKLKQFNKKGTIVQSIDYCDGKINGYVKSYFDDGSLESSETYINGEIQNDLVVYNRDGFVVYSKDYDRINGDCVCSLEKTLCRHL